MLEYTLVPIVELAVINVPMGAAVAKESEAPTESAS
jgi:hypothetical protein